MRVWREPGDPEGLMHTDWGWFVDAHDRARAESRLAGREEIMIGVAAWLDRFLARPEERSIAGQSGEAKSTRRR